MPEYELNQTFTGAYPPKAAIWCNESGLYHIEEIESINGVRQFQIAANTEETEEEKAERIANLTMTPLDFINFLVEAGLTLEQINTYLEANLSTKMQLTYCNFVYCGVVKALMPITIDDITITADMVESAFVSK